MSNNLKFALLGATITTLILATTFSSVYFYLRYKSVTSGTPTPDITKPLPSPQPTSTDIRNIVLLNPGELTWLGHPKPLEEDFFNKGDSFLRAKYEEIGSFTDGSVLINSYLTTEGMGEWTSIYRFVVTPEKKAYLILPKVSYNSSEYEGLKQTVASHVQIANLDVTGIDSPKTITSPKGEYTQFGYFFDNIIMFAELKNPVLVDETKYGKIYAVYTPYEDKIFNRRLYLRLRDNTVVSYVTQVNFVGDDRIPRIIWSDNSNNDHFYEYGEKGGYTKFGHLVKKTDENYISDKQVSGHTPSGQPIYQLIDPRHPVVQSIYKIYKDYYSYTNPRDTPTPILSLEDFAKVHNHFFWQDQLGDWQIFVDETYLPAAEMAKPVIYLYPEKDTTITVKVGADITKSEPAYPVSGWEVLAHSNGQLDYQGQSYSSLFWEGMGHGLYPDISGRGFVVAKNDLIPTIKSHLAQLGLNQKETADFLEFWQPKLPTTPYTRLTWLTTDEMDLLAPLAVSPRPNTAIRVFLDFAPLEKPINLAPQNLSAPARTGFTLVEWGGLLVK